MKNIMKTSKDKTSISSAPDKLHEEAAAFWHKRTHKHLDWMGSNDFTRQIVES